MPNIRTWYRGIVAFFIVLFLPCYSFSLTWPSLSDKVTSGYGLRVPPGSGASFFHRGLDISTGGSPTPLLATADGRIDEIVSKPGFGNVIKWGGDTGWSYNHLSNSQTPNWVFGESATARVGDGETIEMKYIAINTTSGLKYYIPYVANGVTSSYVIIFLTEPRGGV